MLGFAYPGQAYPAGIPSDFVEPLITVVVSMSHQQPSGAPTFEDLQDELRFDLEMTAAMPTLWARLRVDHRNADALRLLELLPL